MTHQVLIIDDSEADQFLSEYTLMEYDPAITIFQAYDGKEAIDLLNSGHCKPDYIFLDINMPRMNGIEFLSAYSTAKISDASVIVMLTSSIRDDDQSRCMAFPYVKKCLSKPLSMESLEDCFSL